MMGRRANAEQLWRPRGRKTAGPHIASTVRSVGRLHIA